MPNSDYGYSQPAQISKRFFTVWEFRSVDGSQKKRVVRIAEPNDQQVQHEYQRVIGQVLACSPAEALALVNGGKE